MSVLKEVYYDLPNNSFEVVLVANRQRHYGLKTRISGQARDPEKLFEDLFSSMPWTAIPYSDAETRKTMQRNFGCGRHKEHFALTMFIVDPTSLVLQCDSGYVFGEFGASGYPFSDKRLEFMLAEDDAAAKRPSLRTLLATSERDYVISNKGHKVSIETLEDKGTDDEFEVIRILADNLEFSNGRHFDLKIEGYSTSLEGDLGDHN
ncbi:hypothetical protein ACET3Z_031282 [Daucus carota]